MSQRKRRAASLAALPIGLLAATSPAGAANPASWDISATNSAVCKKGTVTIVASGGQVAATAKASNCQPFFEPAYGSAYMRLTFSGQSTTPKVYSNALAFGDPVIPTSLQLQQVAGTSYQACVEFVYLANGERRAGPGGTCATWTAPQPAK